MVNRLRKKLKSNKGGGMSIITIFIISVLFNIIYLAYSRDNSQYKWWIKTFNEGLRSSSKAALLQHDYTEENFELIAQGYIKGEGGDFNHFINLNHHKANDIFFKMLLVSTKKQYSIDDLKHHSVIAILEPQRTRNMADGLDDMLVNEYIANEWSYQLTIYKKGLNVDTTVLSKDELYRVQEIINKNTDNITIDLSYGNLINKIKPRTYYIAIIENLPLKGLFMYQDEGSNNKAINMYHFEGINAVRSLDMREGN